MNRDKLPQQLEIISNILNNENIVEIMQKVEQGMSLAQINAVVIKLMAEAIKNNKEDMDALAVLHSGKTQEEIDALSDKEYSSILRSAIVTDVLGFFG